MSATAVEGWVIEVAAASGPDYNEIMVSLAQKHLWLIAAWIAVNATAIVSSAAPNSPPVDVGRKGSASEVSCIEAALGVFQAVAFDQRPTSLPTLKQEDTKSPPKVAIRNPLPGRLSRLRARSAVLSGDAFLSPDTLQIRDVRLQI
jgi:hypothetical protein